MFSVSVPNDLAALTRLTASLEQYASECSYAESLSHNLLIIAEELFVNFVHHGGAADGQFEVQIAETENGIHMRVLDDGAAFNPLASPDADTDAPLENRDIGGLGLHLVRQFAEDLTYQREGNRNVVELLLKS